ncbi:hypothetical protein HanXRQr2_Chr12g0547891 [Helianthus annuus]|uniref:Uncharacterized protein n=1 Tax=Helianthus annuus TaxID=4232 RepID=A0A251RYQ7_HELAN|nr:hypothetical protein HanXRQr2_Chr12g0547891 [Helianthus annuus]KAJ0489873.1 hypothetical protein HanHA300_Chr12g0448921 [Helianthus annuus]KAJ0493888.1 hypothetical protein HanIR_Chr12g0591171 [Helianthus annuus]KAJ0505784.1 hypothetical protein HanHA89_Chr12g0474401 [Helianthus annuus]KAJ0675454.1 hypothetical protein HanLR1_Chr12g0451351 [Helianthus annuus]
MTCKLCFFDVLCTFVCFFVRFVVYTCLHMRLLSSISHCRNNTTKALTSVQHLFFLSLKLNAIIILDCLVLGL